MLFLATKIPQVSNQAGYIKLQCRYNHTGGIIYKLNMRSVIVGCTICIELNPQVVRTDPNKGR